MQKEHLGSFMGEVGMARHERDGRMRAGESAGPKGSGGPIFEELMVGNVFEREEKKLKVKDEVRVFFDNYAGTKIIDIYNTYLFETYHNAPRRRKNSKYEGYSHADFLSGIHEHFWHGLSLYMKVALREDVKKGPQVDKKHAVIDRGVKRFISDDRTQDQITRQFLVHTYAEKYGVPIKNKEIIPLEDTLPHEPALDAYFSEKLRLYAVDFFKMLTESLKREIPPIDALSLAEKVYGHGANIFTEMEAEPYHFDSKTIADVCKKYPLQARERFDVYASVHDDLAIKYTEHKEADSSIEQAELVTSSELKSYIFAYPHTVVAGLEIAQAQLGDLSKGYPLFSEKFIIKTCISHANNYEAEIQRLSELAETLLNSHECTDELCEEGEGDALLRYYKLDKLIYTLVGNKSEKVMDSLVQKSIQHFIKLSERMEEIGQSFRWKSKRRMLFRFIKTGSQANIDRIIKSEAKLRQQQEARFDVLIKMGERRNPLFGEYYAYFGSPENLDSSKKDIIEHGQEIVEGVEELYGDGDLYGEFDIEEFLELQTETFFTYLNNGFPADEPGLGYLKDSLMWAPDEVKDYFEKIANPNGVQWPEEVEEVRFVAPRD